MRFCERRALPDHSLLRRQWWLRCVAYGLVGALLAAFLTGERLKAEDRKAKSGSAAARQDLHFLEAEHAHLEGAAQAGGSAVWTYSGKATWDAILRGGRYRLLMRVRAGYAADHQSGVRGRTAYRVRLDGRPLVLKALPDTRVYHSDESNWCWLEADAGQLKRGLHSLEFTADWHWGRWDAFVLTTDSQYAPRRDPPFGKETPVDLSLLSDKQRARYSGFTLWTTPAEQNVAPKSRPPQARSLSRLQVTVCGNEHGAAVLNVTNGLDKPLLVRVRRADHEQETTDKLSDRNLTLRRAVPLPAPRKEPLADALPRLDEAGLLLLPAGETRQLWVAVHSFGLKPGSYRAQLQIQPLNAPGRCRPQTVELQLNVTRVTLPKHHPLDVFLCEYDTNRPGMRADLSAHFVNWYHNCLIPHPAVAAPDFGSLDRALKRELSYPGARSVYFEHWHFRTDQSWRKKPQRAKWVRGIRRWAQHVHEELKLPYERFTLHIFDEVSGGGIDTFLKAREVVREADPRIRVTMTVTPGITLAEIKRLLPAVDVWCPHMELLDTKPAVIAALRASGKPLVPYHCAENKRFWNPQIYRLWTWRLYQEKMQGLFLWTYLSRDAWQGRTWDGGMVFSGNGAMIPSRRWEMLRRGLQDYLLLKAAARAGHSARVDALVRQVLQNRDDPREMQATRQALLRLLQPEEAAATPSKSDGLGAARKTPGGTKRGG